MHNHCHPSRAGVFIDKTAPIWALKTTFSVYVWVNPDHSGQSEATLLGSNYSNGFWLGLDNDDVHYRVIVRLNGKLFRSRRTLPIRTWSHIGFRYDGRHTQIYINGRKDADYDESIGEINNSDQQIGIGSDINSVTSPSISDFSGWIQGIQIWRIAIEIGDSQIQNKCNSVC